MLLSKFWILSAFLSFTFAQAAPTAATKASSTPKSFAFSFKEIPIPKVVEYYSQMTGQRFVIDPAVTNSKVTIIESKHVNAEEAFNLLSTALSLSGVGISNREDTYVVSQARNLERSYIPVVTELPPLQPERMVTWVVNLKHADANEINKQLRMLTSKDGELSPYSSSRLLISDWVSNLYRVKAIIDAVDQPSEQPKSQPPAKDGK